MYIHGNIVIIYLGIILERMVMFFMAYAVILATILLHEGYRKGFKRTSLAVHAYYYDTLLLHADSE